jgi:glyoxylase-like metal-dependent hydrolase (beta-lactamase superfamily II)
MATAIQQIGRERIAGEFGWPRAITDDLAYLRTAIVNVIFSGVEGAGDRNWVLIDAGIPGSAGSIRCAVARRFGDGARPSAILLTHGHFDHVGALQELAEAWDAPVFAHELELPYLTGMSPYAPPDPTVGGGLMAAMAWMYPRGPINLGGRVHALPADGSVPFMPGWRWIHTPGHTAGHVSFFRDSDAALIAGDAFVTTRQESALAVLEQRLEIHGPPAYYTPDWVAARRSVEDLKALEPALAITGHGLPMEGKELRAGLHHLARNFDEIAVPRHGRYARHPAIADATGVVAVPPERPGLPGGLALGLGVGALAGLAIGSLFGGRRRA